ncbi:hypothetical protein MA16_Dca027638 [Dendrobium catenatum]|uniref:Transmembrane protein n=1 Tax=Dendrobium catenatum TaxID=906689 RepID=A0A2I0VIH6_9ASPA|nr:hypothetical protein MA16_Dca027638 [Dendrobium catenatum]
MLRFYRSQRQNRTVLLLRYPHRIISLFRRVSFCEMHLFVRKLGMSYSHTIHINSNQDLEQQEEDPKSSITFSSRIFAKTAAVGWLFISVFCLNISNIVLPVFSSLRITIDFAIFLRCVGHQPFLIL